MIKNLQDYLSKNNYNNGVEDAEDVFKSQASSIQAIAWFDGYHVIKSYLSNRVYLARERLKSMKTVDDLVRVQTQLQDAEDLLSYLEYMESIKD